MTSSSVLFDRIGRRGRRRVRIVSACVGVVLAGLAGLVLMRLQESGQLRAEQWSPLFNPSDPQFAIVWEFLLGGLANTATAGAVAIALGFVVGTTLALIRVTARPWYRWFVVGAMEFFRTVPVVISIFFVARVLPVVGVDLPLLWYLVIGLTVYNSIAISEIVRAGIRAVPRGQSEAAAALGVPSGQALRWIVLPQAFRIMLPSLIAQLVIVVKDTALGFIIGFEELLRRGEIAVQTLHNPLQMYLLIGLLFFVANGLLSRLAQVVEARLSRPSSSLVDRAQINGFLRRIRRRRSFISTA